MKSGDVTIVTVLSDGSIGAVSHVDSSIADNCIRQQRSTNYARGRSTRVFRSDAEKSNYQKFAEFQDEIEAKRRYNIRAMEEEFMEGA